MRNITKSADTPGDIEYDVFENTLGGYPSELLLFSATIVDDSIRETQVMQEGEEIKIPFVHYLLLYMPMLMSPGGIDVFSTYYTKDNSPVQMCQNHISVSKSDFSIYPATYSMIAIPNEIIIPPDINEPIQDYLITEVQSEGLSIPHYSNYISGESIDFGQYLSKVPFSVTPFGRQASETDEVDKIKLETPDRVKISNKEDLSVDQEKLEQMVKSMIRNLIK